MADMMLPPEYQQEIEDAQRKRTLALALQQFALQNRPQGQMVSGHYVRSNPMQHLANIFGQAQGAYFDTKAGRDINTTRQRFLEDQTADLRTMQGMKPEEAEKFGQTSKFPQSQALAKVLFEDRMKRVAKMQEELAKRVGVDQLPQVFGGQTTGLKPKQEIKFVDDLPVAVPTEYTSGGTEPKRLGPGYSTQTTTGPSGPILTQKNPLSDKLDAIDKTPKTSVSVSTGGLEDPYWKKLGTDLGEADAKIVKAGRDAPPVLEGIERIRKIHIDAKGNYTGGPAAGPVRFLRDLASQMSIPINEQTDLNNAKMQAELAGLIAAQIIGQGRGLTDEDRRYLERAYPSDRLTPAMMPAFLAQYERLVRANATASQRILENLQKGSKGKMPTALRNIPIPSASVDFSSMTDEQLEEQKQRLLRGGR